MSVRDLRAGELVRVKTPRADIPIGGTEYRQIDRAVQEIDGLAEILINDKTER